jgi:hypothetical protein
MNFRNKLECLSLARSFTQVGSGLTRKHYTRMERLASNKQSSLFRKFVNYDNKMFYKIGPRSTFRCLLAPGACIIKLIMAVIYRFRNKLECLSLNTRPGWKGLPGTNTLAYYGNPLITAVISFMIQAHGHTPKIRLGLKDLP